MDIITVEEALERSIFHRLNRKVIDLGYNIDLDNYDLDTEDVKELKRIKAEMETATKHILNTKGMLIEVFNMANNQARGTKKPPRIVVETEAFLDGEIGLDPSGEYIQVGNGSYIKSESVSVTNDFYFKIHIVANTVEQLRLCHHIMNLCLPRRGYIPWYTDNSLRTSQNLLVTYLSTHELDWEQEGIIEKVYRYNIKDVHVIEDIITATNIPPIKIIDIDIEGKDITENITIK